MPKNETGITDTGEQENPLALKQRRSTYGHANDPQAASGDGKFAMTGQRSAATNYGRPALLPAARRRRGIR